MGIKSKLFKEQSQDRISLKAYSAEDEYIPFDDFSSEEDENMRKTEEGNDYARNHAPRPHAPHAPYARASTDENCGGHVNQKQCKNIPDGTACKRGGHIEDSSCCKGCCRKNGGRSNKCS